MYSCTIETRGYEVGARGGISPAAFCRYLEHVRWRVLAEGPEAARAISSGGRRPVVRAQRLELREQVGHHVDLRFTAWIARVGRTSVDFAHRIYAASAQGERPIGLASATVVVLGSDGRPTPLPDVVRAGVVEGETPQAVSVPQQAPANAWLHRMVVRPSDIDLMQHVNQANYMVCCDDARLAASDAEVYGFGARADAPLRRAALDHQNETRLGETLEAATWLLERRADTLVLGVEVRHASTGLVACRARLEVG